MSTRRTVVQALAASSAALAFPSIVRAQTAPVRVGYAIARTGPHHRRAGQPGSQPPAVAEQQNAAGGLNVKGTKRPIELIGSDDHEQHRDLRAHLREVDGQRQGRPGVAAWAATPTCRGAALNRIGYPFLAPTALSRRLIEMKLPYFFLMLQQPKPMMDALVDMLKANGAKTAVVIYVDDLFGLENYAALKVALAGTGIGIVGGQELPAGREGPLAGAALHEGQEPGRLHRPDLPARHHPASRQSRRSASTRNSSTARWAPPSSLPPQRDGPAAEGRARHGLVERQDQPGAKAHLGDAHVKKVRRRRRNPTAGPAAPAWAALEILTAAVGKVGLDRKAIRDYVAGNEHATIIGKIKFAGSENVATPGTWWQPVAERRMPQRRFARWSGSFSIERQCHLRAVGPAIPSSRLLALK